MKPFMKWAGGKRQLLPQLMNEISRIGFNGYYEPFLGGGALFFKLKSEGMLRYGATLSDINSNLIDAYVGVRDRPYLVHSMFENHARNHCLEYYKTMRKTEYDDVYCRAARMIYLNRACYNGLYSENSKGEFNTAIGKGFNPSIMEDMIFEASKCLSDCTINIKCLSFEEIADSPKSGDLVYLDPPYIPLNEHSFTKYSSSGFEDEDQVKLAKMFDDLASRGVNVIASNSYSPRSLELYKKHNIKSVYANRHISRAVGSRKKTKEIIVTSW